MKISNYSSSPDDDKHIPIPVLETFHDHLKKQLGLLQLDERNTKIAEQIIGSIDDDGYLRRPLGAIVNDLAFTQNVETDEEEVERTLQKVQTFDPAGVGARSVRECLLLQINKKKDQNNEILQVCLLYTSPSPRDATLSRMPSSA